MNHQKLLSTHGVFMSIFNSGCLITGESQSGKSELALCLLDRGHSLIADDAVELFTNENKEVHGKAPKLLERFLEVRHLGAINVHHHFGQDATKSSARLDLIIKLEDDLPTEAERLTPMMTTHEVLGTQITAYELSTHSTHHLPILIETTIREYTLQQSGKNANHDLKLKHNQQLRQNS